MHRFALLGLVLAACGANTPVESSQSCTEFGGVEVWELQKAKAGTYRVTVDTVADATAFDPAVSILRGADVNATDPAGFYVDAELITDGDDDFACTYPPPEYRCPTVSFTLSDGDTSPQIVMEALGSCAGTTAAYVLEVERDGKPASVDLVHSQVWTQEDFQ